MNKSIYLVSRNPGKLMAANSIFGQYGITLLPVEKDYPEIQADSSLEIARHTALQAAEDLNAPAVREDHSLFINALGIPGPFTNYIEKKIPAQRLAEIIKLLGDNSGYFEVATVYAEPDGKTFEYVFQVPMTFGGEIKGENPKGWNGLIRLLDETRAITEYPEEERLHIWSQGYQQVAKYLSGRVP
jgi:inosine/xanthosine triphosphate pyrophosphatase family protein